MLASPASPKVRTRPRVRTLAIVVLLAASVASARAANLVPPYLHTYGPGDGMGNPYGIAIGPGGESYVCNTVPPRIEKYSKDGTHLLSFGSVGTGFGQFQFPYAIAVDPSGNVWVLDIQLARVLKFTSQGVFAGQFGSPGTGDGEFDTPRGIAIGSGNIYVADSFNHRVQVFTLGGVYYAQWGTAPGPGQLGDFWGIATDVAGNVYVADSDHHRVVKFTANGTYLTQWGSQGSGPGQFDFPATMTVDLGGNLYVCDLGNRRIERFTTTGAFVSTWGSLGNAHGQFQYPIGIACNAEGDVHVVDGANSRVEVFRNRAFTPHEFLTKWGSPGTGVNEFTEIRGIAFSHDGNCFVADRALNRIQRFTSFGAWSGMWGTTGSGNGQLSGPAGVAVDSGNNVYVTEDQNLRVQKFDESGNYLGQWGSAGSGPGQFNGIWDIAIDSQDDVFVTDLNRVQRFSSTGVFETSWSVSFPTGICVDRDGSVYVVCPGDAKVRKYTRDGTFILEWGSQGSGPGQFNSPRDVAADTSGYVYVTDNSDRVQQFTMRGAYITEWGESGSGQKQLSAATMMAVDMAGNLAVTEIGNWRVQKFFAPPEILAIEDVPGDHGNSVRIRYRRSSGETPNTGEHYEIRRLASPTSPVVAFVPADGVTDTATVATLDYATPSYNAMYEYRVALTLNIANTGPVYGTLHGYAVDDAPYVVSTPDPTPITGLALEAIQPNPVVGKSLTVHFTLASDAEACVELVSVAGRRVAERVVKGAGRHEVALDSERSLAPGVYWVRLFQGSNQVARRFVALR